MTPAHTSGGRPEGRPMRLSGKDAGGNRMPRITSSEPSNSQIPRVLPTIQSAAYMRLTFENVTIQVRENTRSGFSSFG